MMQSQSVLDSAVIDEADTVSLSQGRDFSWLQGNARLINRTEQLLGAHLAHAGLIMFWAGSFTLLEISRYSGDVPISDQGLLLLPRLANLGWGVDSVDAWFAIAIIHNDTSTV